MMWLSTCVAFRARKSLHWCYYGFQRQKGKKVIMAFPTKREIHKVLTKLKSAEGTRIIGKDAPLLDRTKFQLCQRFIIYMHDHKLSQVEMASLLEVDKSRVNDIVKCKIELFSLDKLIRLAEKLKLNVKVLAA